MNKEEIYKIIEKHGLHPASRRELSFFALSAIARGYIILLKKELGYSYEAMGAIGSRGEIQTLFNEAHIASETEKFIEDNFDKLDLTFERAKETFSSVEKDIEEAEKSGDAEDFLQALPKIYPSYIVSIGIYNCFWRYLGNESNKGRLSHELVQKLGKEREVIAKLYPILEEKFKSYAKIIGGRNGFDGDLLRYMTLNEMKSYILSKTLKEEELKELKQRREGYFHLFVNGEEHVFTDKEIIQGVKNRFFKVDENINSVKGHAAFPGKVKGVVYNFYDERNNHPEENFVFVTSMTHPKDVALMKKSVAIVTDEGGVLSHAAITSRELKVPCVIGTKIATKVLKDGDLVEFNANNGTVKIIKRT